MRKALKAQLSKPAISASQQKQLCAKFKLAGGLKNTGWVLLIFVGLVAACHYTGLDQQFRIFMEIEGNE